MLKDLKGTLSLSTSNSDPICPYGTIHYHDFIRGMKAHCMRFGGSLRLFYDSWCNVV